MIKRLILNLIRLYQKFISPSLGHNCRFYPSCSEYAQQAIRKRGVIQGLFKSVWRILRCHPLNKGGVDLP